MNAPGKTAAKAFSDRRDRLVSAEEPLASLQFNCGGTIPGTIAIPSLLESVRKAREYGLKIARTMQAQDDHEAITAWIELTPLEDGCEICVRNWQAMPFEADGDASGEGAPHAADRALADFTAILDAEQNAFSFRTGAPQCTRSPHHSGLSPAVLRVISKICRAMPVASVQLMTASPCWLMSRNSKMGERTASISWRASQPLMRPEGLTSALKVVDGLAPTGLTRSVC